MLRGMLEKIKKEDVVKCQQTPKTHIRTFNQHLK